MSNCRMCSQLQRLGPVDAWNEPLMESANLAVLPSLGALVEGWLLLVPKQHLISMGAVPDSMVDELHEMKHIACSILQLLYGEVSVFEHGPSRGNCKVGCSVDHAHLHIVPVQFDLASAVTPFLPEDADWSRGGLAECRSAFHRGEDYLYLEQPIGAGRITTHRALGSQLFRRAIASRVGTPNQFDWREHPELPNVIATIKKVRAWAGTMASRQSYSEAAL
ncbi:MAG: hypothetical protein L0338_28495 [Acidobacteria bacterium]|nr:hypothetical protein [Acidobacteriota bacterium]